MGEMKKQNAREGDIYFLAPATQANISLKNIPI